jgi:imidazolonepropionase-like amidohydrolase
VLLPGAFYVLREKQVPPVDELRSQRVPMAIATDWRRMTAVVTLRPGWATARGLAKRGAWRGRPA